AMKRVGAQLEVVHIKDDHVTDHFRNTTSTVSTAVERMLDLNVGDNLTVETTRLSTTQLIIRRGSILLLMSLILGGGIAGHLLIPVQSSTFIQSFTNTTTAIPADNITL
ncbi:hypothetical protein LSAT2_010242, partial [Lamellibrachia satsuma]